MIDHLVYLTHDLGRAAAHIEAALGVKFSPGGRHLTRGTMNKLLRIGPKTYLELLAVDPDTEAPAGGRWMGMDLLPKISSGRLARWAWAVTDGRYPMAATGVPLDAGPFEAGSRALPDGTTLEWQLTDPGTAPLVRARPFLIDWLGHPTPAERLPEVGCRLVKLLVGGPGVDGLRGLRAGGGTVTYANRPAAILEATLTGPGGRIVLI
ncbi:VOC family protein [Neolewinella antarctica]|uniref:Glyoxalase-like domain-containing protein n=1 Tax=Neolewinella antarctica TaxID=442734 RepID=A0ABX0XEY5_9BACT|nr:VOC family protein [Neolewinella antarctica]NJC27757.1 hypothetical protein [Neolewinella antarctica]